MKYFSPVVLLFSIFLLQNCGSRKAAYTGQAFERNASLQGSGFKQKDLDSFTQHLKDHSETTGFMVLYDGKVVYEYGDVEEVSYLASCRKSVLSMLYGKHLSNGNIHLEESIGDLGIDEDDGLLEQEKKARVNDIITSRSGVFHVAANGGYDKKNFLERGSVEPGEYFVYNNWDFNVAGHILEQKTGHSVYAELEEQLAIPLGFQDWNIKNQKKKHKEKNSRYPAYHMYLSTRDMAKIGQLMLNDGQWEGKQLVPKDWIKTSTQTVTPHETIKERYGDYGSDYPDFSYGYMWWLVDDFHGHPDFEGAYSASGWGGQYITVLPARKIVIAHKTSLSFLIRWGITKGGVSDYAYWGLVDRLIRPSAYEQ